MWLIYALLAALFAALVVVFAKIGMQGVDSDLATAIRTVVVLVMAWGIVLTRGLHAQITQLNTRNWVFILLSGLATGLSWLFYYRAVQIGKIAQVVPIDKLSMVIAILLAAIFLGEIPTTKVALGAALVVAGTLIIAL